MADIKGYLQIIEEATGGEDVRDAIVHAINEINQDSAFTVTNKTIESKLSELNKTYSARSGEVWKQVTINVTDDSGNPIDHGNVEEHDLEINNNTPNQTFNAKTIYGENAVWGDVIVNVDHSGEWDDIADLVTISTSDLDNDGTWSAAKISKTAVKAIKFSDVDPVKEKGGYVGPNGETYYPITFNAKDGAWENGETSKTINIPEGNLIDCDPKPNKVGKICIGWDGDSVASRKTTVYAKYDSPIVDVNEIREDWSDILAAGGVGWPIGSYKTLFLSEIGQDLPIQIPYEADLRQFPDIGTLPPGTYPYYATLTMIKVAEGEGGTGSSWISAMPRTTSNAMIPAHINDYDDRQDPNTNRYYDKSKRMIWLNSVFLNWCLPKEFRTHIKPVTKHYRELTADGLLINKSINQRIWLPSVKELWITGFDDDVQWEGEDEATEELFTKAIGEEYFNAWLGLQDGITRMNLLDLTHGTWPDLNGFGGTRDHGYGQSPNGDHVLLPLKTEYTIEGQQIVTSVFMGKAVSRLHSISPHMIGFCISA